MHNLQLYGNRRLQRDIRFWHRLKSLSFRKKKQASSFFFSQFALSFNKIGCISEEKSSKLFFLLSICTIFANAKTRSDARVAEEARLESVYTPKAYREFESRSLRKNSVLHNSALFFYSRILKITNGSNEKKRETICCFPFAFTPATAVTIQDSHLHLPSPTAPAALRQRDHSSGGT